MVRKIPQKTSTMYNGHYGDRSWLKNSQSNPSILCQKIQPPARATPYSRYFCHFLQQLGRKRTHIQIISWLDRTPDVFSSVEMVVTNLIIVKPYQSTQMYGSDGSHSDQQPTWIVAQIKSSFGLSCTCGAGNGLVLWGYRGPGNKINTISELKREEQLLKWLFIYGEGGKGILVIVAGRSLDCEPINEKLTWVAGLLKQANYTGKGMQATNRSEYWILILTLLNSPFRGFGCSHKIAPPASPTLRLLGTSRECIYEEPMEKERARLLGSWDPMSTTAGGLGA
ncbi:hypothetical protein PM082_013570 [Marasmius tenuissimus]|nr:hypothetical protein PM082_013570 [Marasmius tenuissimus]